MSDNTDELAQCKHWRTYNGHYVTSYFSNSLGCPYCEIERLHDEIERLQEIERRFDDIRSYAGLEWGEHMRESIDKITPAERARYLPSDDTCAICGEHANEHLAITHEFTPGGKASSMEREGK